MPTALMQPATAFNFMVSMWDVQGPVVGALGGVGGGLASAAANLGSQLLTGAFSECDGLDSEIEVESYQEGGRNFGPRRFFKRASYKRLSLKRGVTPNTDLWDWQQQVIAADAERIRKSGLVVLFDRGGPAQVGAGLPGLDRLPVAAWYFANALPERLEGPKLDAKTSQLAIEGLELSHESLTRVSLSMIPGLPDLAGAFAGLAGGLTGAGVAAASG